VDPATGIVYETEDQGDVSGFYRFVPERKPSAPGHLAGMGGKLQMLKVTATNKYEAGVDQAPGTTLAVSWVDIPNPDPVPATATVNGATASGVFKQGFDAGGVIFRRLEGCWYAGGKIYFGSTNGGNVGMGQIWVHDPVASTISLVFESPSVDVLNFPDNMTVSPRGGIVVCEDEAGAQFIRGVSTAGEIFEFARNLHNSIEFAGACFSPDGQTLFINIYGRATVRTTQVFRRPLQTILGPEKRERALTLAIWGPWTSGLI
jgi:secreted PhoX family phosphatase